MVIYSAKTTVSKDRVKVVTSLDISSRPRNYFGPFLEHFYLAFIMLWKMGPFVNLEDGEVAILLEAYSDKKKSLEEEIQQLTNELNKLNNRISQLKGTGFSVGVANPKTNSSLSPVIRYDPEWTWNEKIKYVFDAADRKPLTANDIVNGILTCQPSLDRTAVMKSVSATLTVGAAEDKGLYSKEDREGQLMLYRIIKN